jgi:uncharacterized protein (TIGR02231 family)
MRILRLTALVLCLPVPALAEDILLRADIARALVFAEGAEVTREVALDLPPGRHSLVIPMRDLGDPSLLSVTGPEGARIGAPVALDVIPIEEGALDTEAEAHARAALQAAEDAVVAAEDALARRDADISGIEAQLDYLAALARGGAEGAEMPADPATLAEVLATLGGETARLGRALQDAREARREDETVLEARRREVEVAEIALRELGAFGREARGIRIDLEADADVAGTLAISYLTPEAGWWPTYVLRLETEAERLTLAREITLRSAGPAVWRDVAVRFSSAIPDRRRTPSELAPDPVRIAPPPPEPTFRSGLSTADLPAMSEPAVMAEGMVLDRAEMVAEGLAVVYDYAAPVSIGPTGQVTLPLDRLDLDATLEARAVPRRDATAFLVAMARNGTAAPILPGLVRLFRDGELLGSGALPLVPAGGEVEIGFGPLDHLRLFWQDLSLDEGDRGVFATRNDQRRRIAFGVENTSGEAQEVRLLYAAPFSEQEDLDLEVRFAPVPDETDVDDLRGVSAWRLAVPPASEVRIEMVLDLAWQEDMTLTWQP